ncbi:DUF2804 domain-containing protein [Pelomonas cellulosilytica]|uniref:DUF2804 domain-containing protein n=1 Tax=Pelomonas cellulosilytica TaxID=2906762 RepID=A0ABS8XKY2_9BURK|nr:DUF2804 domain-containing protein [Pelomonas sp. P8]MCE4553472.1 DUF2804 domain-containing protein [Pelomonas sp. P8]
MLAGKPDLRAAVHLPPSPACVVLHGAPAHGRYAGRIDRLDWSGLTPRPPAPWRWWRHKRWHYVGLGHDDVFLGVAFIDVGWATSAFAYMFDRRQRRMLADWGQEGLPRLQARIAEAPLAGADSWFRGPRARLSLCHGAGDLLHLTVQTPALRAQAQLQLADMAAPLLAIGPVAGGLAHATQKTTALPVQGWAEAAGRRFDLAGAWAAVDASNGLLARDTAWRWASAHGPGLGFNLQSGYFGAQENVLWLDGQPIALGPAHFGFDAGRPLSPWHITTDDGLLDLVFTPEGARAADKNLGWARSRYVQPIGTFAGQVKGAPDSPARAVAGLLGVTEDHVAHW